MTTPRNFQVNLRGVIDLLSDHLYSGPQVYLRELLQNAVDAVTARQHSQPEHRGSIRFEVFPASAKSPATLVVTDDGVGLSEDEVHEFLATIGQSSKRDPLHRDDFIGQFGIGLLSAFVVCEEIVVITRSVRNGARTVEWKGCADGTYSVRLLEHDFEPGTQVFLRAKSGTAEYFEPEFVQRTARHYGCHLPVPIQVQPGEDRTLINEDPPWRCEYTGREIARDRWLDYGRRVFDMDFLDAIPLESRVGGVEGVAFVLPFEASLSQRRT
ncbi:MAG TPA: ATP-binding protein, partial [Planctomycetaceae bacterium]|nr:ATP-binding protein [Planctomycetaceae bacterium]